jgi:glycosyltransferase involved in cell wall biosynthesis
MQWAARVIVIPLLNEEDNVGPTVNSCGHCDYEVVLVNDAGTDHTLKRMLALVATDPHIRLLDNPANLGFGGAYRRGAKAAT